MEIGSERERRELMSDGIGGGVAAEREDLREDWREVKESLDECGSIWDCRVRNVSRPGTEAEFVVVKRRRRRGAEENGRTKQNPKRRRANFGPHA